MIDEMELAELLSVEMVEIIQLQAMEHEVELVEKKGEHLYYLYMQTNLQDHEPLIYLVEYDETEETPEMLHLTPDEVVEVVEVDEVVEVVV